MYLDRKISLSRLNRTVEKLGKGGALFLMSPPEYVRNRSTRHTYRQHSFFNYLTGFNEPESALIINPELGSGKTVNIFLRPSDALAELWEGRRLGVDGAMEHLAVDRVFSIDVLWQKLPELLKGAQEIYYEFGQDPRADLEFTAIVKKLKDRTQNHTAAILDMDRLAGALRVIKSEDEIVLLDEAARITELGFARVLDSLKPGMNERAIYGTLVGEFLKNGADMEAYSSIVAGGPNACTLHYTENNALLNSGELLLIDAGAQYRYYACDVTRTFPINGSFSQVQKEVYEIVLNAQTSAIELAVVGSTLKDLHQQVLKVLSEGLINLGVIKAGLEETLEKQLFKPYYPHNTSHWIGMDVHDVGIYKEGDQQIDVPFAAGHYFSVEPGLYFDKGANDVPKELRGIGIRIEDDVLITKDKPRVVTSKIPKNISDIERAMDRGV